MSPFPDRLPCQLGLATLAQAIRELTTWENVWLHGSALTSEHPRDIDLILVGPRLVQRKIMHQTLELQKRLGFNVDARHVSVIESFDGIGGPRRPSSPLRRFVQLLPATGRTVQIRPRIDPVSVLYDTETGEQLRDPLS